MTRYARQTLLPEIGAAGQARLAAAHVLVIGAGGLAAPALPLLAGAGVGRFTVMDGDRVSLSNLHRQTLFTEADIGRPKAQVAAARCAARNSAIAVAPHVASLTPGNAADLVAGCDLVLDCADSHAVSYTLSDGCLAQNTPLISASVLGFGGYAGGFCGTAPSLRALFPDAPDNAASCATAGVMGPVVAMLGALQAQMALAALLDLKPSPLGQMLQLDARSYHVSSFRFDAAPEPATRFAFAAPDMLTPQDLILDLRPSTEAPRPLHPAARRIRPEDLASLPPENRRLALCCATGLRAWRAAETLCDNWPGEILLVAASASD